MCECIEQLKREKEQVERKLGECEGRVKELEMRNKETIERQRVQKGGRKESREHAMVIKSLKKVIN